MFQAKVGVNFLQKLQQRLGVISARAHLREFAVLTDQVDVVAYGAAVSAP